MVGEPFADYLNFSVPLDSAGGLLDGVLGILYEIGSFEETQDGVFVTSIRVSDREGRC